MYSGSTWWETRLGSNDGHLLEECPFLLHAAISTKAFGQRSYRWTQLAFASSSLVYVCFHSSYRASLFTNYLVAQTSIIRISRHCSSMVINQSGSKHGSKARPHTIITLCSLLLCWEYLVSGSPVRHLYTRRMWDKELGDGREGYSNGVGPVRRVASGLCGWFCAWNHCARIPLAL